MFKISLLFFFQSALVDINENGKLTKFVGEELKKFYEENDDSAIDRYAAHNVIYHGGRRRLVGIEAFREYTLNNRKNILVKK